MFSSFIKRPAMTIAFIFFFIVLGCVSYFNLGIEDTPSIDYPLVSVKVVYAGATPSEIESQVVKPIEEAISELSEIKKVQSRCYDSLGYVIIEFNLGVDVNQKNIEVKDKVEAIVSDLPDGIETPIIEKVDIFATSVMDLVLESDTIDTRELYDFADQKLKPKFSAISGIADMEIIGGKEREIQVKLDPILMKKYYVSITDVISVLNARNLNIPGGDIQNYKSSINVKFVGEFSNLEDIRNMPITTRDGEAVPLKKFAQVIDGYKKVTSMAKYNGKEVVILSLNKVSGANEVKIAKQVKKKLPKIKEILEGDMKLFIVSDNTENIIENTNGTIKNILIGIVLTIIILYLFTGNLRITFIASIVIPFSIIASFLLIDFSKFTINSMTLLAVATALGTLISNAIVIVESILAKIEQGLGKLEAAVQGTEEVFVAVLAAAGTNIVVFTPIAFMGGMIGQFMKQFGLTVVYTTLFSILASFTLTPMLSGLILKDKKDKPDGKKFFIIEWIDNLVKFILKEYRIIFDFMFKRHILILFLGLVIFVSSFILVKYIDNDFFPKYDQDLINVSINLPQGTSIDKTKVKIAELEKIIDGLKDKYIKDYFTSIGGNSGVETAQITINLKPRKDRDKTDLQIMDILLVVFAKIPDVEISLYSDQEGNTTGDLSLDIYGLEFDVLEKKSKEIIEKLKATGYFKNVSSSFKDPKDEIKFISDQKKLSLFDISNNILASTIRTAVSGDDSNFYREKGEEYTMRVELGDDYKKTSNDLKQIFVITQKGLLPVVDIGNFVKTRSIPTIYRRDSERIITLDLYIAKSASGQVRQYITDEILNKIDFPDGYGYRFSGTSEMQDESNFEVMKAFIIATLLTYLLLVAIMNSFLMPFVIATTIITSLAGVFLVLFFTNSSINLATMLAIIMLVGLVVNNAILVLEEARVKIRQGEDLIEAIWHGFSSKFVAVLMTSIAIIVATYPQLYDVDGMKKSMGAVMIGGMLGSMFFTFFMVPILFWYTERFLNFIDSKRKRKDSIEENN